MAPEGLTSAMKKIRASGCVPVGVLYYDPNADALHMKLFEDIQDIGEANALLTKFNIAVVLDGENK